MGRRTSRAEPGGSARKAYDSAVLCRTVTYTARPRFDGGQAVWTGTIRLLVHVLADATPDEDDEPDSNTAV